MVEESAAKPSDSQPKADPSDDVTSEAKKSSEGGDESSAQEKTRASVLLEPFLLVGIIVLNVFLVFKFFTVPFAHVFSAPVVPVIASFLGVFGVDSDLAVRWVLLSFYILGPVTLYMLVREVSGRRMTAALAAVLYSLPVFSVRFEALTVLGDGAHVAALTLIPLAAFWLLRFLKRGAYGYSLLSGSMVVLVGLTSPFGLFVLIGVLMVITFSEMLLGSGRVRFVRFMWVFLLSAGLSAFWYNPSFIQLSLVSPSGQAVVGAVKNLIPISLFVLPILGAFGLLVFDKRPQLQPLFIALGLTAVFGLISFAGGLVRFAVGARSRYFPELVLSISFLWGIVGAFLYDLVKILPKSKWFPVPDVRRDFVQKALVAVFIVFSVLVIVLSPFDKSSSVSRRRSVVGGEDSVVIDIASMRDLTGGAARIIGYSISLLTVLAVVGVKYWVGTQKNDASAASSLGK